MCIKVGDRFGSLTITDKVADGVWGAQCLCGLPTVSEEKYLINGDRHDCGCSERDDDFALGHTDD